MSATNQPLLRGTEHIGFAQLNTNRSVTSMDLALARAAESNLHFLLCSEPNKKAIKGSRWFADKKGDAAITRIGLRPDINKSGCGNGFVWIYTMRMYIFSCYISPNTGLPTYESFIHDLFESIMEKLPAEIVITGDFNSKSPLWGGETEDRRGAILGELLATTGLTVINNTNQPTFVRGNAKSTIDLTMATDGLVTRISEWTTRDDEVMSPHRLITFNIEGTATKKRETWRRGPIDRDRLGALLKQLAANERTKSPENMMKIIKKAYEQTTPKIRTKEGKLPYWWTNEIREIREETLKCRRRVTRIRGRQNEIEIAQAEDQYKNMKKRLSREIQKAKKLSWRNLLDELEGDIYGDAYKIVKKKMQQEGPGLTLTREDELQQINRLFPESPEPMWTKQNISECPLFSLNEIRDAAKKLKTGKAPGPDKIPSEAIKIAAEMIGEYLMGVYNDLLRKGAFPEIWKTATVVLIEKPKKAQGGSKAYRPLCLINTAGKLYEALLNKRITDELDRTGKLSPNQHGFRKGHSTINAITEVLEKAKNAHRSKEAWCVLALVDVKNAFNTASWARIITAMENKGLPHYLINVMKEYLHNRTIETKAGNSKQCNVGVPQGSVLGPTLWNIMYDGILELNIQEGVHVIGYADDIAVIVEDKNWDHAKAKTRRALRTIHNWLIANDLEMAPEKTEITVLKYGRRKREGTIDVAGREVEICQEVKYLGVILDTSVSFGPHIRSTAARAAEMVTRVNKLMPNMRGPGEAKRRMLGAVVNSVMLYGAPIWVGAMNVNSYRGLLQSVQRKAALRVCRGYRTVSYEASVVISSMIPIHLLARERKRMWEADHPNEETRKRLRKDTMEAWQQEWDTSEKGRWTRRLIQDVAQWVERKHGQVDYFLTQWLTGHGSFNVYVKKIGKTDDERCEDCGETDTPEHALYTCSKWQSERAAMQGTLGTALSIENTIRLMLSCNENWVIIKELITKVMKHKEIQGRQTGRADQ